MQRENRNGCTLKDAVSSGVKVVAVNAALSFDGNDVLLPTSSQPAWFAPELQVLAVSSAKMQDRRKVDIAGDWTLAGTHWWL